MTAAGQAQAAAARAIAPAVTTFNRSLASTRNAGKDENAVLASNLHGCFGLLAAIVNSTGHAASGQWRGEFLPGQASDPDWLKDTTFTAAQRLQDAANLTIAIRAARPASRAAALPVMHAEHAMWRACHDLDQLVREHQRVQVPDYAAIFASLHAACAPLAAAADAIAPRLKGIDPDPGSIWCEDFTGDLTTAYRDAARHCRAAAQALDPVSNRTAADVRTWRSRSRPRP